MLMCGLALGLACGDDDRLGSDSGPGSDSGDGIDTGAVMLMDSGGTGGVPSQVNGLGSATADCVEYCRAIFADGCTEVQACFSDGGGGCSPQRIAASACASSCSSAASYQAALTTSGCTSQYQAYETCVQNNAAAGTCDIFDAECGIEWGVYAGCAGL